MHYLKMTLIMACVCNASNLNHNFFHALYIKCQCFLNCKGCGRNTVNDTLGCVRKKIFMSYPNTCLEWWQKPRKLQSHQLVPGPRIERGISWILQLCIMHTLVLGYLELLSLEAQVHHIFPSFASSVVFLISCSGTVPMDSINMLKWLRLE